MSLDQINLILGNPSWDVLVVFGFIAVGFFYGVSAGKTKLISFLFSLYISGFLFENFYYLDHLVNGETVIETFFARVFIFLLIVLALNSLFSRFIEVHHDSSEENWWHILLLSFLASGLLFSYLFHIFPARDIFTFSPVIQNIFASNVAFFWWLTLPLVALFLARR